MPTSSCDHLTSDVVGPLQPCRCALNAAQRTRATAGCSLHTRRAKRSTMGAAASTAARAGYSQPFRPATAASRKREGRRPGISSAGGPGASGRPAQVSVSPQPAQSPPGPLRVFGRRHTNFPYQSPTWEPKPRQRAASQEGGERPPQLLTRRGCAVLRGGPQQRQHLQRPQEQRGPGTSRAESHCSKGRMRRPRGFPAEEAAARAAPLRSRRRPRVPSGGARLPSRRLPPNDQIGRRSWAWRGRRVRSGSGEAGRGGAGAGSGFWAWQRGSRPPSQARDWEPQKPLPFFSEMAVLLSWMKASAAASPNAEHAGFAVPERKSLKSSFAGREVTGP
nr:translation initiation factor IF-2-like [Saimiri boliviensis boliviensis]